MVGASSMQFALGRALEAVLQAETDVDVHRFGRHSTGLSRPDYFDWIDHAERLRDEHEPDLVIAQFGGNDCQGLANHRGRSAGRFGTDEWDDGYYSRVQAFVRLFTERDIPVVMMGMPIMRSPRFRERIIRMNDITEYAANTVARETDTSVIFVSTHEMTWDENREYWQSTIIDGRRRRLRADDGTHLSRAGAAMVAELIMAKLREHFVFGEPVVE